MLKLVNTTGMEKIELYLQLLCIKPQVNQSFGTKDINVAIYRRYFGCWGVGSSLHDFCKQKSFEGKIEKNRPISAIYRRYIGK